MAGTVSMTTEVPGDARGADALAVRLQPHYRRFRVAERLLFTGHSHQAWPDVARDALVASFDDAAERVDEKWSLAFARIEELRGYLRRVLEDPSGEYTPAANTHALVVALLSALDLRARPRIVSTDGEFHSIARQLDRLEEAGVEVVRVPALPVAGLADRLAASVDDRTAAVLVSRVLFGSGLIVPGLGSLGAACRRRGVPLVIDDYHGTNVVPWSLRSDDLEDAFVLIGGYKYLQWGEGNCFLRYPAGCALRPVVTGWFASFSALRRPRAVPVSYDDDGARFAGGTMEPASAYRASGVVRFFDEQGLRPDVLRGASQALVGALRDAFAARDLDPAIVRPLVDAPLADVGGFLALEAPAAVRLQELLAARGVLTDARGSVLRFGPAPYVTTSMAEAAMDVLAEVVRADGGLPSGG